MTYAVKLASTLPPSLPQLLIQPVYSPIPPFLLGIPYSLPFIVRIDYAVVICSSPDRAWVTHSIRGHSIGHGVPGGISRQPCVPLTYLLAEGSKKEEINYPYIPR